MELTTDTNRSYIEKDQPIELGLPEETEVHLRWYLIYDNIVIDLDVITANTVHLRGKHQFILLLHPGKSPVQVPSECKQDVACALRMSLAHLLRLFVVGVH